MSEKLIDILKKIETMNTEEMEKIKIWIDFNIAKRELLCSVFPKEEFFKNSEISP